VVYIRSVLEVSGLNLVDPNSYKSLICELTLGQDMVQDMMRACEM
jgi:hypothetical protein